MRAAWQVHLHFETCLMLQRPVTIDHAIPLVLSFVLLDIFSRLTSVPGFAAACNHAFLSLMGITTLTMLCPSR